MSTKTVLVVHPDILQAAVPVLFGPKDHATVIGVLVMLEPGTGIGHLIWMDASRVRE